MILMIQITVHERAEILLFFNHTRQIPNTVSNRFSVKPPAQYSLLFADSSFQISTDQIRGLNLNLQYKNNELFCTTGISSDTFLLTDTLKSHGILQFRNFSKTSIDFDRL